jgi:hypothetical protein
MFAGKILERGRVKDLLASKTLEELYFGAPHSSVGSTERAI